MSGHPMEYRDIVKGCLLAVRPIHVGGLAGPDDDASVLPVACRDGVAIIPGTALAGALRAALGEKTATGPNARLWGDSDTQRPSLITVLDAVSTVDQREEQQHVSLDRTTGAAAQGHLFAREIVPEGAKFSFGITVESADAREHEAATTWLKNSLEQLVGQGFQVGAAASTGLGKVRLDATDLTWECQDFTSPAGLFAAVNGRSATPPELAQALAAASQASGRIPPATLRISVDWRPVGAVMSLETKGRQADTTPLCSAFPLSDVGSDGSYHLKLAGSSIKGSLRTRAEYIGRVVLGEPEIRERFVDQMSDSESLPGITALFGAAGDQQRDQPGFKGSLTVSDVLTNVALPAEPWVKLRDWQSGQSTDTSSDGTYEFTTVLDDLNQKLSPGLWFDFVTRNAIDRWSGGVVNEVLFSALEPHAETTSVWAQLQLDLDLARLDAASQCRPDCPRCQQAREKDEPSPCDPVQRAGAALALLVLVLRDLADGWIPLGFGSTRGLGSVELSPEQVHWQVSPGVPQWPLLRQVDGTTLAAILHGPDLAEVRDWLNASWQEEITIIDESRTGV